MIFPFSLIFTFSLSFIHELLRKQIFHSITFAQLWPTLHSFLFIFFFGFCFDYPKSKLRWCEKIAVKCRHGFDDFFRFHFQFSSCGKNIKYNHVIKLSPFHHQNFHPRSVASKRGFFFLYFDVDSCLFNLPLHQTFFLIFYPWSQYSARFSFISWNEKIQVWNSSMKFNLKIPFRLNCCFSSRLFHTDSPRTTEKRRMFFTLQINEKRLFRQQHSPLLPDAFSHTSILLNITKQNDDAFPLPTAPNGWTFSSPRFQEQKNK